MFQLIVHVHMKRQRKEPQWLINLKNQCNRRKPRVVYESESDTSEEEVSPTGPTKSSFASEVTDSNKKDSNKNQTPDSEITKTGPSVTADCSSKALPLQLSDSPPIAQKRPIKKKGIPKRRLNL